MGQSALLSWRGVLVNPWEFEAAGETPTSCDKGQPRQYTPLSIVGPILLSSH